MATIISMLRAVNVGGHNKIKMDALRELYQSLKLRDAQTYVQSGNAIFRTEGRDLARLTERIEGGIEGIWVSARRDFANRCGAKNRGCEEPVPGAARD